jgi:hypothetical protein
MRVWVSYLITSDTNTHSMGAHTVWRHSENDVVIRAVTIARFSRWDEIGDEKRPSSLESQGRKKIAIVSEKYS